MTLQNTLTTRPINTSSLTMRMLIGAGIALTTTTIFLSDVDHPKLEWGELWMIRPLIIVPIAGALGGLGTYLMEYLLGYQGGWSKIIAVTLSIIGFVIGTVLGFAGTLWN